MNTGLQNKVAMIAGASRGLGFAVAQALAKEGAKVSISSRDAAAIHAAGQKIGGEVLAMPVDVTSNDAITAWHKATIDKFGGVDILLANAGTEGVIAPIEAQTVENFEEVFRTNVVGVWLFRAEAAPSTAVTDLPVPVGA